MMKKIKKSTIKFKKPYKVFLNNDYQQNKQKEYNRINFDFNFNINLLLSILF